MFGIALMLFILFLGIWGFMVYIRKTMWDAVHRNLLDLEDRYSGHVIRRGFASRPIFHGEFNGAKITINFSRDHGGKKRRSYIDISYELVCPVSLTIANKTWLDEQGVNDRKNITIYENASGQTFVLVPSSGGMTQEPFDYSGIKSILDELNNLAYIFLGETGIICEFISEQVIRDTEIDIMEKRLSLLKSITQKLSNEHL